MELYQLRGLLAIAAAGTLTRAAESVHVTQPALSAQLKALEDEFGLQLFERTAAGMVATPGGRRLIKHAEKVLAAAQAMHDEARTLKGDVSGKVTLGTLSDPDFIRLGAFMAQMLERFPLVEVEMRQAVTGEALAQVRDGGLDASFFYGDLSDPQIAKRPLRDMRYRVVAPAAWGERLAHADWTAIATEPWIIPPTISTHHQMALHLLGEHGVTPDKVVAADTEVVVSSLVMAGVGVALMREDTALALQDEGRVVLWGEAVARTTLCFIYRAERGRDPRLLAMLDALQAVWSPGASAGSTAPPSPGSSPPRANPRSNPRSTRARLPTRTPPTARP